jgi:hypothetical protein
LGAITYESDLDSERPSSASAAVTLAREKQTPRFLNRSTNSKTVQRRDSSPGEASHDRFPQVDAKSLDFHVFFEGPAGISSSKSVAHYADLDICNPKDLQN